MKPEHCEALKCAARKLEKAEQVLKGVADARKHTGQSVHKNCLRAERAARVVKLLDESTADLVLDAIEAAMQQTIDSVELPKEHGSK